jgi:hypothetical protein
MTDFPGFTIPEGAWLPPEIAQVLPFMETAAEIKVVLAALLEACQIGHSGAVLSLTQLERLTGLSRDSVISGRKAATDRGLFSKRQLGGQVFYLLTVQGSRECRPRGRECRLPVSVVDTLSLSDEQQQTLKKLSDFGVAGHVAKSIVLEYKPDYILRHLAFTQAAADAGLSDNPPGWLITSLREDWQEPLITSRKRNRAGHTWYTEEESQRFIQR